MKLVTNLSWNGCSVTDGLRLAWRESREAGAVHFVSGGNDGDSNGADFPCNEDWINCSVNLTYAGTAPQLNPTSNYGAFVDFAAPGTRIYTTDRAGSAGFCPLLGSPICDTGSADYAYMDGTSFSSPLSAGVAAMVWAMNPTLDPPAVEWVLQQTAVDLGATGYDAVFGFGLPRMWQAVMLAESLIFFNGFEDGSTLFWSSVVGN